MTTRIINRLILAALTLLSLPLQAANLIDIFNQAQKNDPVILAARAQLSADAEIVPQSRATLLPSLSLTANTQIIDRETSGGANLDERFNSNSYAAQLSQPLFRADRWFTLNAAKASKKQAEFSYQQAQQELILRVATAYFDILRNQNNLSAAKSREVAFRRQLEQATERFDVGLIAATDVYEAQAELDLAVVLQISSEEQRHNSYNTLQSLTNQNHTNIDLLANKDIPVEGPTPALLKDWVDSALANNHQLTAQKYQLEVTKQLLYAEKSGHLPTIDAKANYIHTEDGGTSFLGQQADTKSFALELSMPLFEGGLRNSKVREAHYRHEQAKQDYQNTHHQIREQIQTQYRTVTTDVLRIKASKTALKSSSSALEATKGGYEVGTRNIIDVLQAQNHSFDAQRNYSNALYDYTINLLTLKQLAGTLTKTDLEDINGWLQTEKTAPKSE